MLFLFALNTASCGFFTNTPDLTGFGLGSSERRFFHTKLVDILSKNFENNDDWTKTIFQYIPAGDVEISLGNNYIGYNNIDESEICFAVTLLQCCLENFSGKERKIDELAAETILNWFYQWLLSCSPKKVGPKPDFRFPCNEMLYKPAGEVINELLSKRSTRNIFSVFLKALQNELGPIDNFFARGRECQKLSVVYRHYLLFVINFLIEKADYDRRFWGDDGSSQTESFYVFIPSNNVKGNLADPIINVDQWVNRAFVKE